MGYFSQRHVTFEEVNDVEVKHAIGKTCQIYKEKKSIQTNSFILFTCLNPVLLVPDFGQVGLHEE